MDLRAGEQEQTRSLGELDVDEYLADPALKQNFVTPMFDLIAPRYDRFTRVFSFGMDGGWKRRVVAEASLGLGAGGRALDLACGTGDLAFALAERVPGAEVVGIDASTRMIELAQERRSADPLTGARVRFAVGDMMRLDVSDGAVDVVTAGYALRNVPDHREALAEIARVLKPGGILVTLDFYRPEPAVWRSLFLSYLRVAGDAVGWLWHRQPVVYGYIARSVRSFVSAAGFSRDLHDAGLAVQEVHTMLLGGTAIHVARRRG